MCAKPVGIGDGWFQKNYKIPRTSNWLLRCLSCKNKGNNPAKPRGN